MSEPFQGSSAFLVQLVGCRTESIENVLNCARKWRLLPRIRKRSCQTLTSYDSSESNASTNSFDYLLSWIRSRRVRCAGAYRSRAGFLEQADGGTIFMDEVGEMTARMQVVLLDFSSGRAGDSYSKLEESVGAKRASVSMCASVSSPSR